MTLRLESLRLNRPIRSRAGRCLALAGVALLLALLATVPARADIGDGIAVGSGRLKLGIDLSLRYDSQAGAGQFQGGNPNPADLIALGGGEFQLNLRNETTYVNFNGALNYNQYLGIDANTRGLSYVGAAANGEFDFNQNRPVGVDISEGFSRSNTTTNPVFGLGVLDLSDDTRLRVRWRPGGGALEFGLSGDLNAQVYNSQVTLTPNTTATNCGAQPAACAADASAYDSVGFLGKLDGTWRLLPKTGLLFEVGYGTQQYLSTTIPNVNAEPVLANIGFGTLLTTRLTFNVKAGYSGLSLADHLAMHNDFDGELEVGYHFSEQFFGRIGGGQSLSSVGGVDHFYDDDRVFAELGYKPLPILAFSALGSFDYYRFGSGRLDQLYGVAVGGDWTAVRWLHVGANFTYSNRISSVADTGDPDAATAYNYDRFVATISLSFLF